MALMPHEMMPEVDSTPGPPNVSPRRDSGILQASDLQSAEPKNKVCRDCRRLRPLNRFPTDHWGRIDAAQCFRCIDEDTPTLLTEMEAAHRLRITLDAFRSLKLTIVGGYAPPRGKVIPLYDRGDVDGVRS